MSKPKLKLKLKCKSRVNRFNDLDALKESIKRKLITKRLNDANVTYYKFEENYGKNLKLLLGRAY